MISNPYAKKKVTPQIVAAPHGGNATDSRRVGGISIPHIPVPHATTFSQAFDSIDTAQDSSGTINNQNDDTANTVPPANTSNLSERDHHVFLQHQPHVLYVSTKQRGNGILDCIRNVPVQYHTMVPDYILGRTSCALFLSLRYHNLYPEYIFRRIAALQSDFTLRVLLVLVDVDDNADVLLQLNKAAVTQNMTLILAWSEEEAARYLETYKILDGRDASTIQKAKDTTQHLADQVTDFLTACKSINKTDAASVLTQFGSVRAAMAAAPDELSLISGLGQVKVKRLHEAWHKPFSSKTARERQQQKRNNESQAPVGEAAKKRVAAAAASPLVNEPDEDGASDEGGHELEPADME